MFKKVSVLLLCFISIQSCTFAATLKVIVKSLEAFSSASPSQTLKLITEKDYPFKNNEILKKNTILTGEVIEIVPPKIGKRDAYFYCKLTSYTDASQGSEPVMIDNENAVIKVKPYKEFDMKENSINAGVTVAGLFVDHIAYPINFARGVISPYEDKSRLASGAKKMYDKSVFSYISKGQEMIIRPDDKLMLIINYNK